MSTRILTLTGTPHPQAEVTACDAEHGILTFRWLDANGQPVDSGGSVARFTPPAPLPQAEDYTGPAQYPEVDDATLVAAIENPLVEPAAPRRQETRTILDRLTSAERAALFGSTNTDIRTLVAKALATGAIRDDDPDFPAAVAGLDALNIISENRWPALLAQ